MSETTVITRPDDAVIFDHIRHLIATYPPLTADRTALHISVHDGAVTVSGHVMSPNTRRFFLSRLATIPGVTSLNADGLYDDPSVRLDVSRLLPPGLQANVHHGVVVLSGDPPLDMSIESVADRILALPGVARVVSGFGG
jgi:BON domain